MPDGQERVCIIVDVSGFVPAQQLSMDQGAATPPPRHRSHQYKDANKQPRQPMNVSLYVLNVLQNHYVERLGRGLILNMPWFVNGFFKAISPFMDPITRDKVGTPWEYLLTTGPLQPGPHRPRRPGAARDGLQGRRARVRARHRHVPPAPDGPLLHLRGRDAAL